MLPCARQLCLFQGIWYSTQDIVFDIIIDCTPVMYLPRRTLMTARMVKISIMTIWNWWLLFKFFWTTTWQSLIIWQLLALTTTSSAYNKNVMQFWQYYWHLERRPKHLFHHNEALNCIHRDNFGIEGNLTTLMYQLSRSLTTHKAFADCFPHSSFFLYISTWCHCLRKQ